MKQLKLLTIIFFLFSCKSKSIVDNDLTEVNDSVNLFAFIGEKIEVNEFNATKKSKVFDTISGDTLIKLDISMDYAFNAKYKVIKNVYNKLPNDTVDFTVFSHYGRPSFEKYKYVLLYISKYDDTVNFYHQKYIYDSVKKVGITWRGMNGKSIKQLFNKQKKGYLGARGIFD